MAKIISGGNLPNIPWQDKPADYWLPIWRYDANPVIGRNPFKGMGRIYNSAVIPWEGKFKGVFRSEDTSGRPFLYIGDSDDGINWEFQREKIHMHDPDGTPHDPFYAYDPRCVKVDDTYYILWCGDFDGASIGVATTKDFKDFTRLENPFLPFNRNAVLFPKKIDGKFVMLSRPSDSGHTPFGDILLSQSPDMKYWGEHRLVMQKGGRGWWQGVKIGCGPAPIEIEYETPEGKTEQGWLMFYHGVATTCNGFVYSFSAAILDHDQPSIVKYRCGDYMLTPEQPYETTGFVDNVCFPVAALTDEKDGKIAIYYGCADTVVGLCFTTVDECVKFILAHDEKNYWDTDIGRF